MRGKLPVRLVTRTFPTPFVSLRLPAAKRSPHPLRLPFSTDRTCPRRRLWQPTHPQPKWPWTRARESCAPSRTCSTLTKAFSRCALGVGGGAGPEARRGSAPRPGRVEVIWPLFGALRPGVISMRRNASGAEWQGMAFPVAPPLLVYRRAFERLLTRTRFPC